MSTSPSSLLGLTLADGQTEPIVIRTGGLRHVAPYWIVAELPIGRRSSRRRNKAAAAAAGDAGGPMLTPTPSQEGPTVTIGEALDDLAREGKSMLPSARWWRDELSAGRLALKGDDGAGGTSNTKAEAGRAVRRNDILLGRYHYHERSIPDVVPTVVYEDERYVVVDKPAGVDVLSNPGGGRVRNSLPGLLLAEMFAGNGRRGNDTYAADAVPMPAHRLDGPVSGVVCCGRTNADVKRLSRRIELRETTKFYLARVVVPPAGIPTLPLTIDAPLGFDPSTSLAFVDRSGRGKDATTIVTECRTMLDGGKTAVVVVRILTGRKHQIRCHLRHAGLPIANDGRYGGTNAGNHLPPSAFGMPNPPKELVDLVEGNFAEGCEYCSFAREVLGGRRGHAGPTVGGGIWLHSWRYEFPTLGLKFETELPPWACGGG